MRVLRMSVLVLGEYSKSWEDVHKAQDLGAEVDPGFLDKLRKASGREW